MSEAGTAETKNDTPKDRPVDGNGVTGIGFYLVFFVFAVVGLIWYVIPACDAFGFVVTRLYPEEVLTKGGEELHIAGEGIASGVTVHIGGNKVPATVISPFELVVTTPEGLPVKRTSVLVSQTGFRSMEVPGGVKVVSEGPVVTGVTPARVVATKTLHILGKRFKAGAAVKIDNGTAVPARFVSSSELEVTAPAHAAGVAGITVEQDNGSSTLENAIEYFAQEPAPMPTPPAIPLQVSAIEPATSDVYGGKAVTITGVGFTSDTQVRFGGYPARSVKVDGPRFITAVTPMHPEGPVSVLVGNDQGMTTLDGKFAFSCPAPSDSTMILLILLAGALGGLVHALRSFYWYAGQQKLVWNWAPMYFLLPFASAALGFVFFLVARAGLYNPTTGTNYVLVGLAALVGMFSAQASEKLKSVAEGVFEAVKPGANSAPPAGNGTQPLAVTIKSLSPASGPVNAKDDVVVTIVGTGFTGQSVVRFDNTAAKTKFLSATKLEAVAPARSHEGVVDVEVETGGSEVVKQKAFSYQLPKGSISSITPTHGPVAGGTKVDILGTNFSGSLAVLFGDKLGTGVNIVSASKLEVVSPPNGPGIVGIRVDAGNELIAVLPKAFEYKP